MSELTQPRLSSSLRISWHLLACVATQVGCARRLREKTLGEDYVSAFLPSTGLSWAHQDQTMCKSTSGEWQEPSCLGGINPFRDAGGSSWGTWDWSGLQHAEGWSGNVEAPVLCDFPQVV